MFPEQFHIIPMLDDSMLDGVPELEHASFAACEIIAHVDFRLVAGTGDDDIVLGSSYAAS
jgi:hypothetical protein